MDTSDWTTWGALIGTWVLVVGTLYFAYWQLRQTQRLHSASTILDLRERFYNSRMRLARRELSAWLLRSERGPEPDNWEVCLFFELLGSLTHTRALDERLVWNAFGPWITAYYVFITEPVDLLSAWRSGPPPDPLIFAEFERLARRMMERDARAAHGPRHERTAAADARYVLEGDSALSPGFDVRAAPPD
ncbi:MAG TPA: hypothetical protein VMG99_07775 [Thermoplasmata archaeon]|jgi:hypothetical protein|nr:hypothetical protein [Thermoplasmata archaeon]